MEQRLANQEFEPHWNGMTLLFGFRNISVFAEHNPSLAELKNGYTEIIEEFNNINKAIVHRYVPDVPGRKEKQTYDYIKNKIGLAISIWGT